MKASEALHNLGQSIWLDNITRELLDTGTLERYIDELSISGLNLESDDLRSRHHSQRIIRFGHSPAGEWGPFHRRIVLQPRYRRPDARCRFVRAHS